MKFSKKIVLSIYLLVSLFFVQMPVQGITQASSNATHVSLKINDYYVLYTTPKAPYIDSENRFMIPLRSISELLGAKVGYDAAKKTASVAMDAKTVVFKIGSKIGFVDGEPFEMDTVPVLYKNAMFIPLSFLIKNLDIQSKWDQANKLYTLTGDHLMQTEMIKYYEHLDTREGPVKSNNGFMPVSYILDLAHFKITIKSKNVTGTDLPEGVEDVHPYFIFDNSSVFYIW
jgi:hypothetical protein